MVSAACLLTTAATKSQLLKIWVHMCFCLPSAFILLLMENLLPVGMTIKKSFSVKKLIVIWLHSNMNWNQSIEADKCIQSISDERSVQNEAPHASELCHPVKMFMSVSEHLLSLQSPDWGLVDVPKAGDYVWPGSLPFAVFSHFSLLPFLLLLQSDMDMLVCLFFNPELPSRTI